MICYDTFQKSSKHVCANRCQRISNPMLAYPGYNMLVLVPAVSSVSGGERSEIYHTPGTVSWFSMHFLSDTLCWCATQMPPRPIRVLSELMSVESLYVAVILSEIFQNFRRQQEVVEHPKKRLGVDVKRRWLLPLSFLESVRRSCTLGWFVERVLLKVRKGTGYVALSDLPDDEEENANSGTVCGSISNDLTTWIILTVYMYIVTQKLHKCHPFSLI